MSYAEDVPIFATVTFLVAGFVKGMIGMGLPTIAIALLVKAMSPVQAATLVIIPSFATNVWQLFAQPCTPLVRRFWPMLVGIGVGTWAASGMLSRDQNGHTSIALGGALVIYALLGLTKHGFAVPHAWQCWLSPPIGVTTGVVTSATGIYVIPAVPYLSAIGLGKDELVQALGLSFTVSTVALGASLFLSGEIHQRIATTSLIAVLPTLAGMLVGQRLRVHVNEAKFRLYFLLALLGLGAHQIVEHLL